MRNILQKTIVYLLPIVGELVMPWKPHWKVIKSSSSPVSSPLVIREIERGYFTILGPTYVYGVMDGEFVRE